MFNKEEIISLLGSYEVQVMNFEKGDFGSLEQIRFNNKLKGGVIDFWNSGMVGINVVDYIKGNDVINILRDKNTEQDELLKAFENFKELIK